MAWSCCCLPSQILALDSKMSCRLERNTWLTGFKNFVHIKITWLGQSYCWISRVCCLQFTPSKRHTRFKDNYSTEKSTHNPIIEGYW
jgi:hypothetical protein